MYRQTETENRLAYGQTNRMINQSELKRSQEILNIQNCILETLNIRETYRQADRQKERRAESITDKYSRQTDGQKQRQADRGRTDTTGGRELL